MPISEIPLLEKLAFEHFDIFYIKFQRKAWLTQQDMIFRSIIIERSIHAAY